MPKRKPTRARITYAGPTRQPRYPWDAWFETLARRKLVLCRGADYFCQPYTMMIVVRLKAKQRGLRVSVYIREERLTIIKRGAA